MSSSLSITTGFVAPYATSSASVAAPSNDFNEKWKRKDYYQWIEDNTNPDLILAADDVATANNMRALSPAVEKIDIKNAPLKNLCTYVTTGNKPKYVNANGLFYHGANNELMDSGLRRAQTPKDVKGFLSWIIKSNETVENSLCLFNLVPQSEQRRYPYQDYFNKPYQDPLVAEGKKGFISVVSKDVGLELRYRSYVLELEKWMKPQDKVEAGETPFAKASVHMTNYLEWTDGDGIDPKFLNSLAAKVIKAKSEKQIPVIHCLVGKGRTGTLAAAVIIKEAIESGNNVLGIGKENYRQVICKLIVSLRDNGGGDRFVGNSTQLELLFNFAEMLLGIPEVKY